MKKSITIKATIADVTVEGLKIRRKIIEGRVTNERELVATLPVFGTIPLDDDMQLKIFDTGVPKEERKWVPILAKDLLAELLAGKYTKNSTSTSTK
jgi:hypothetical protein